MIVVWRTLAALGGVVVLVALLWALWQLVAGFDERDE